MNLLQPSLLEAKVENVPSSHYSLQFTSSVSQVNDIVTCTSGQACCNTVYNWRGRVKITRQCGS